MCDDHADVWIETHPAARKQYKCCECGKAITKGERYWKVESLFDGAWERHSTCLVCEAHWRIYAPENEGCITPFGLTEIEQYGEVSDKFVIIGSVDAECMKESFYEEQTK